MGEGGKIKNSPLSPCGRGVGGEGDYKNGMLPNVFAQKPGFLKKPGFSVPHLG
jgi:hypothetical protein